MGKPRKYRQSVTLIRPTYDIWFGMVRRCTNPKATDYDRYGGRGIFVCARWLNFDNFFADMGEKPDGMSLDRIDNDGPYSPENCRWATGHVQTRNTSATHMLSMNGVTLCATDWAQIIGIDPSAISHRRRNGWPEEYLLAPKGSSLKGLILK